MCNNASGNIFFCNIHQSNSGEEGRCVVVIIGYVSAKLVAGSPMKGYISVL